MALELIDEGNYGQCEVCGQKIAQARLEAMPYVVSAYHHRQPLQPNKEIDRRLHCRWPCCGLALATGARLAQHHVGCIIHLPPAQRGGAGTATGTGAGGNFLLPHTLSAVSLANLSY